MCFSCLDGVQFADWIVCLIIFISVGYTAECFIFDFIRTSCFSWSPRRRIFLRSVLWMFVAFVASWRLPAFVHHVPSFVEVLTWADYHHHYYYYYFLLCLQIPGHCSFPGAWSILRRYSMQLPPALHTQTTWNKLITKYLLGS